MKIMATLCRSSAVEPRKVLMIDDEEDIRVIGKLSLQAVGGWTVVLASSGPEGLRAAETERPDLILLDVMMPEMDGPTTFRSLQENPSTASIPVIFMTARVQKQEVQSYLDLGAAGVVAKPFDPMTLPAEVREILSSR
jgi:two-component system, OmpR family, response regulator